MKDDPDWLATKDEIEEAERRMAEEPESESDRCHLCGGIHEWIFCPLGEERAGPYGE